MNNDIKYNFVGINQSLDTLVTNTFEALESLETSINSIAIENEEIADLLESAKKSVKKNIKIIKDAFEQNKNNAKAVCNEYKSFETQAKEHAFFKNDLSVKILGDATYMDVSEMQSTTGNETWLKIPEKNTNVSDVPTATEYTIKSGDTLTKIANRNNTTIDELMKANPSIKDPDVILAGVSIVIPGVAATTTSSEKANTKKEKSEDNIKTAQKTEKQENKVTTNSDASRVNSTSISNTIYKNDEKKGFVVTNNNKKYELTESELDLFMAVVASEAENSSPDDCLAVASSILNRCESEKWSHNGTNPISQISASGQYDGFIKKEYIKFLNGNYGDNIKNAVLDAINGTRNCEYTSFNGKYCEDYSDNQIHELGNRFSYL